MKRMLINATQSEERRLAVVDGQSLVDYEVEIDGREQRKGNIYKGVITRIEPSLEACFVDYGEERHGFLPFKEVSREYFQGDTAPSQAKIQDVLTSGQELLVQVEKEERGNKGAALTTFISLAGRYVVLMPNNPRGGGVSRRIEGTERAELKQAMSRLEYPKGMSVIARTAGIGRTTEELQWDLSYLNKVWTAVTSAAESLSGAQLIYQESNLVIRALRDYFNPDIGEILVDTDDIYEQAYGFMSHVMSEKKSCVKRYSDATPLFSRFQIEHQIESAYARTVQLPSGGAIVIDHTEALVSVDVNSARAIRGGDIEETAFKTNVEAAREIARQARLRDLAGLIVIDFIDMDDTKNRREVENTLRGALRQDRARVQFGSISKFGLLEMSRQRLRPALSEGASIPCPRCGGSGHVRDIESSALQIMRVIQEESMKDGTAGVNVQVPVTVASFLLNEKRSEITQIEVHQRVEVQIIPNQNIQTPNYRLERLKDDDPRLESGLASYKLAEELEDRPELERRSKEPTNRQKPVIRSVVPDAHKPEPAAAPPAPPAPVAPTAARPAASGGFWASIKALFGMGSAASQPADTTASASAEKKADASGKTEQSSKGSTTSGQRDDQKGSSGRGGGQSRNRNSRSSRSGRNSNRQSGSRNSQDKNSQDRSGQDRNRDGKNQDASSRTTADRQDRGGKNNRNRTGSRDGDSRRNRSKGDRSDRNRNRTGEQQSNSSQEQQDSRRDEQRSASAQRMDSGLENANRPDDGIPAEQADTQQQRGQRRSRGGRRNRRGDARDGQSQQRDRSSQAENQNDNGAGSSSVQQQKAAENVPVTQTTSDSNLRDNARTGSEKRSRQNSDDRTQSRAAAGSSTGMADSTDAPADASAGVTAGAGIAAVAAAGAIAAGAEAVTESNSDNSNSKKRPDPVAPAIEAQTAASGAEKLHSEKATDSTATEQLPATDVRTDDDAIGNGVTGTAAQNTAQQPPAVTPYILPAETLQQILQQSGLQWVHSNPERVAAIQAQIAAEPQPVHVPRERPPVPEISDEPLILVETRRDLAQVQYPFDS